MSLSVKTQNKRGATPQFKNNLGYIANFIDSENSITIDAYKGLGESYHKRDTPEIKIQCDGEVIFIGSIEQLKRLLI